MWLAERYVIITYSSYQPIHTTEGIQNKVKLIFGNTNPRVHNAKLERNAAAIQG
jgi:hypothetical protein